MPKMDKTKARGAYRKAKAASTAPAKKIAKGAPVKATAKQRSAVVVLTIGGDTYNGKSSGQYGHAEMDALRKFLVDCDKKNVDAWATLEGAAKRTVHCPNQPICGSCSIIMKALGFTATAKKFSTEKSGGVSWGCSMKVRSFLAGAGKQTEYDTAMRQGAK